MPEPTLPVDPLRSEDPKKEEKKGDTKAVDGKDGAKANGSKKEGEGEGEELSEEDQALKGELEMLVERLKESNTELYRPALEALRTLIRTATSSMTSVPKPLKFLRPHYKDLEGIYAKWEVSDDKSLFADILSVLAMTYSDTEPRGTMRYHLLSSKMTTKAADPGLWGHEYVRHLAAEIGSEATARLRDDEEHEPEDISELVPPGLICAKFFLEHHAEPDGIDLLEEIRSIDQVEEMVDENTYTRVCTYMISCANFLVQPDDVQFLRIAHSIYMKYGKFPEAMALAIRLGDKDLVKEDFDSCGNQVMKRQLAFILARGQVPFHWIQPDEEGLEELPDELLECLSNTRLSQHFKEFGKEMGALEPKSIEDVYKTHLEVVRPGTANVDSARANLASTFVNAFANAGFGNDKLMVEANEGESWIYKNKDHGMFSAAASLGLSLLWDTDVGLSHVDKYTYSSEENIKAGALLATGILNCNVRTEADAALALLGDQIENPSVPLKTASIMGLGLAYVGSHRQDLRDTLLPYVADEALTMEIASLTSLALGFIFVGSSDGEIASTILQTMMERDEAALDEKWSRFMGLGLALLFLGRRNDSDATVETLKVIEHKAAKQAAILVEMCSLAGSTQQYDVQKMLEHCHVHIDMSKEDNKDDDTYQSCAVIGIALIAMGEDVSSEMVSRLLGHLMQYCEPNVRKMVPIALGLTSASNPQLPVVDTLSKYSHDSDLAVALNAIFAMGLVGAGTNNARIAQMLRQLATYYHKEPDCLFMVRIAQGLVYMGKGTLTINPFFSDRTTLSKPAMAGILAVLVAFTDAKAFILDKYHWMLYFLVTAMQPRFMITLDEELKPLPISVRVGQAVDVVGQAGKPRTITGFQTHTTPVRLSTTERAELATEEYIPYAHVLEGFVILKKNPGWESEDKMEL